MVSIMSDRISDKVSQAKAAPLEPLDLVPDDNSDLSEKDIVNGVEKNNLNRLARHIAEQLAEENYSPAIIRGSFRAFEAVGFLIAGFVPYFSQGACVYFKTRFAEFCTYFHGTFLSKFCGSFRTYFRETNGWIFFYISLVILGTILTVRKASLF